MRQDSTFRLYFKLSEEENSDFNREFGTVLSTSLILEIVVGPTNEPRLRFAKQGSSSEKLASRMGDLAKFITDRFSLLYIPTIRTEQASVNLISRLLAGNLADIEKRPEYTKAIEQVRKIEAPIISEIEASVRETLGGFIPQIRGVRIERPPYQLDIGVGRGLQLHIDDGTETSLEFKGDGIKSLAALALFQRESVTGKARLLAVEEPEAHLHAGAVHELRRVLEKIAESSQLLISTIVMHLFHETPRLVISS